MVFPQHDLLFFQSFPTFLYHILKYPTPTDRTKHNNATYYYLNLLQMISAFSCNTLFTFFSTELMFSFQFNLLSKTTPKYLYVSTLSTASPLMYTGLGHLWFFLKINAHLCRFGNIQIQVIFIHRFTKFSICLWYIASSSLQIFPTSSVSSANFTTGHDSSVLLQSAVYSAKKNGC